MIYYNEEAWKENINATSNPKFLVIENFIDHCFKRGGLIEL